MSYHIELKQTGKRHNQFRDCVGVCVSFPCSGRNWLQNIINGPFANRSDIGGYARRSIYFTHDLLNDDNQMTLTWDYINKFNNSPLNALWKQIYNNRKIVLLTRDPRDVITSYFYQKKHREPFLLKADIITEEEAGYFDGTIDEFAHNDIMGIRTIIEFMNSWADDIKNGALHIRYEDMHKNIKKEMKKIIKYLGLPLNRKMLAEAIEKSSFRQMNLAESLFHNHNDGIPQNARKYRSGKVGGYIKEIGKDTVDYMNDCIKQYLDDSYMEYKNA